MRTNRLVTTLFSLGLMACNYSADTSLVTYIASIKARPILFPEAIPHCKNLAKFQYPASDSRPSPFKPKFRTVNNKVVSHKQRVKQLLEQFSLETLSFVGLLKQESIIWALISYPGGEIAYVKLGDYLGKNEGKIINIDEISLQLEEKVHVSGKWTKEIKKLDLI